MDVDLLMFDLGGVLVEFSGVQDLAALLPTPMSPDALVERWMRCPHSHAFGLGRISAQEYAERFTSDWEIPMSPRDFQREYRSWTRRLFPGTRELLAELRPSFRLAALSNSNELHWDRNVRELGIADLFEQAISSHQIGLSKPDPAIYELALSRLGVPPGRVLFFDDLRENVDAALGLGMQAAQVNGVGQIRHHLEHAGLSSR